MHDLEAAVRKAAGGDLDAFADVTRRFQHMAFGYALSYVRNFQDAEDVVQEAFVAAWYALPSLAQPAAFAGWLRSIVRHQAHRVLRRKPLEALPLTALDELPADAVGADHHLQRAQDIGAVFTAIAELPRALREAVVLFYVHDCSQQDIATFLGLPVTTVNNRLHAARAQLKRKMVSAMKDTLRAHQLPDDFATRIGWIVRAREHVVDVRFDPRSLPDVLTELAVSDEPRQRAVTLQVIQRLGNGVVRCVAASAVSSLSAGMTVLSSGREITMPVSREAFDRIVQLLASSALAPGTLVSTGIKVIDVMCPLVAGGTLAIAGEWKAGTAVVLEELVRRLSGGTDRVSIFTFVPGGGTMTYREMMEKEGYSEGSVGAVQTFFFRRESDPWTSESLSTLKSVDTDPVQGGLVASLAHPGGNVTGVTFVSSDLAGKRLQFLKEAAPAVTRVAVLWNPDHPDSEFPATQAAGRSLGVHVQSLEVRGRDDFTGAFAAANRERMDAVVVVSSRLMSLSRPRILALAAQNRLLLVSGWGPWAAEGGLLSYGPDLDAVIHSSATYVDRILKGARPAEIPVEQPTKFQLVINLKTAKAAGLTIPPSLLARADQVIE